MRTTLKILKVMVIAAAAFFAVTFTAYFFNLDMKLLSKLEPILNKYYDTIKRDKHI